MLHDLNRRKRLAVPLHAIFLIVAFMYWGVKSTVIGRGGVPIHFFPALWENGRILLGVLGYYFRSLVFPFQYDMFLPVEAVKTAIYSISGFLFLILMALLLWLGRKKTQYLQAWIWIAPFLAGYLLMVFTPIYPFSISSSLPAASLHRLRVAFKSLSSLLAQAQRKTHSGRTTFNFGCIHFRKFAEVSK